MRLFCLCCQDRVKHPNSVIAQSDGCPVSSTGIHYFEIALCPGCGHPIEDEVSCHQCGEPIDPVGLMEEEPREDFEELPDWSACRLTRTTCDDCSAHLLVSDQGVLALIGNGKHEDYFIVESVNLLCGGCHRIRVEKDWQSVMDAAEVPRDRDSWADYVREIQDLRFGNQFYRWTAPAKLDLSGIGFGPPFPPI